MQIIIVKFVDFFRRVPTGARLKGDTLKLEVYNKSYSDRLFPYQDIQNLYQLLQVFPMTA